MDEETRQLSSKDDPAAPSGDVPFGGHRGDSGESVPCAECSVIENLRALAQEATPGPWKAYDAAVRVDGPSHLLVTFGMYRKEHEAARDAAYIAAANPAVTLRMCEVVDRARRLLGHQGWADMTDTERDLWTALSALDSGK